MVPMPLSYVPIHQSGYSSNMTFIQRAVNVVSYCLMQALFEILCVRSYDALMAKFNITAERSFRESFGNAELVIFLADFAMEYPEPLLPGGFNAPQRRTPLNYQVCLYPASRGPLVFLDKSGRGRRDLSRKIEEPLLVG